MIMSAGQLASLINRLPDDRVLAAARELLDTEGEDGPSYQAYSKALAIRGLRICGHARGKDDTDEFAPCLACMVDGID